jgi:hypothetical protein
MESDEIVTGVYLIYNVEKYLLADVNVKRGMHSKRQNFRKTDHDS